MSKVDAQRAMREAKYARERASGPTRREAASVVAGPTAPAARTPESTSGPEPVRVKAAPTAAAPQGERCGHKSMNGRACTREANHPEKNHRYG